MSSDHKILEKIDLYTSGEMGDEEKKEFERALEADPQLYRQMELSMMVDQMVVAKEMLKLKEQMKKDLDRPKSQLGNYLGLGLLAVVVAGGVFYYTSRSSDPPNIARTEQSKAAHTAKVEEPIGNQSEISKKPLSPNPPSVVNDPQRKTLAGDVAVVEAIHGFEQKEEVLDHTSSPSTVHTEPLASQKPEQAATKHEVDICATLQKNVEFSVTPSCKGEETGEVRIHAESVKGGTAPYEFILGENQSSSYFGHLPSGSYSLWVKDAQNCRVLGPKVFVPEKNCKGSQQYIFNPEYDQAWAIPYEKEKKPNRIVIIDKNGRVFYESTVSDFHPSEWKAESSTGLVLTMGLYFFNIEYADGTLQEGSIMISK